MLRARVLEILRLPMCMTIEEVEALLGIHRDNLRYLVKKEHLEAMGATDDVALRFWGQYINSLRYDKKWGSKALNLCRERVSKKNAAQKMRKQAAKPPA